MIELFEDTAKTETRRSSKGNQLKWEAGDIWYKADSTGYEGLSEYVISHLLQKSSLHPEEFVLYEPEQIRYKRQTYNGVKSHNFLGRGQSIITLERLFKTTLNESLNTIIYKTEDHERRLRQIVSLVEQQTGIQNCTICLPQIIAAATGGMVLKLVGGSQAMMLGVAGILLVLGALTVRLIETKHK